VRWRPAGRSHEVTWSPVAGADSYAIQVSTEPGFADPLLYNVRGLTFAVPPLSGPVHVRLRSITGGEPGAWGPGCDLSTAPASEGSL
jgi:hypothetical protein